MTTVTAQELHAGDWIKCPDRQTSDRWCWIGTRRQEGENMLFTIGRGPGHVHRGVVMSVTEGVDRISQWPKLPPGMATR